MSLVALLEGIVIGLIVWGSFYRFIAPKIESHIKNWWSHRQDRSQV